MSEHVVNILPLHYDRIEEISNSIDDAIFTYNAEQKRKPYIFMDEVTYSFLQGYYTSLYDKPIRRRLKQEIGHVVKWLGRYKVYIDNDLELGNVHLR